MKPRLANASARFRDDMNVLADEVRRVANHYGLHDWRTYIVVAKPGEPESYFISAEPDDETGFAEKIRAAHKGEI